MASERGERDPEPAAFLHAAGWPPPVEARRVSGGWDTAIWRVVTPDGAPHALRVFRADEDRPSRERAEREALAMRAARAAELPVPPVEAVGEHEGRAFMLMGWATGRPLLEVISARPWSFVGLGGAFGRVQARLHSVAPPAGLPGVDFERWERRTGQRDLIEAVRARGRADRFCHGDYHPANVLAEGRGITAVVDFANVAVADRRVDLGWTNALLVAAPLPPGPGKPAMQLFRRLFAWAWRRGYREEAGAFPLDPLFEAFGAAAAFQDIEDAVREGRGWARPEDVAGMRRYIAGRMGAAGLA